MFPSNFSDGFPDDRRQAVGGRSGSAIDPQSSPGKIDDAQDYQYDSDC